MLRGPHLTCYLNIKPTETICVKLMLQLWSLRIREMITPGLVFFLIITYGPSHFGLSLPELSMRELHKRTKLPTS
jgi:hypothetical protein